MEMLSLLIVDDNPKMRRMLMCMVDDLALSSRQCSSAREALIAYAEQRADYVLMDVVMEEIDGITATRQLKAHDPTAQIIIVTSYGDDELRRAAQEAGAVGYVVKDDLLEVRRLLLTLEGEPP